MLNFVRSCECMFKQNGWNLCRIYRPTLYRKNESTQFVKTSQSGYPIPQGSENVCRRDLETKVSNYLFSLGDGYTLFIPHPGVGRISAVYPNSHSV